MEIQGKYFAHSSVNNEHEAFFFYFNYTHMFQILMTRTTVLHLDGNMPYAQHREEWEHTPGVFYVSPWSSSFKAFGCLSAEPSSSRMGVVTLNAVS